LRVFAIVGAILVGALLIFIGAFGARWLSPEPGATQQSSPAAVVSGEVPAPKQQLDLDNLRELLAVLDSERRSQILDSEDNFKRFVDQETLNQAVLAAAYSNGAEQNQAIKVLMERAGQRVLVEAYLNEVVRRNLDTNFPSDAQVRQAFNNNPALFRTPKRMHRWQIIFALDNQGDGENKAI